MDSYRENMMLDLILGFYHPEKGEIKFYGIPTENLEPKIIRNRIAVVSQKPYLF
ncbi:hypothetical protein GCM10008910_36210 [Faecalicatena orotica]